MRTESLWGGQRRAARRHWWRQVLGSDNAIDWNEVFDEMVALQFHVGEEGDSAILFAAGPTA